MIYEMFKYIIYYIESVMKLEKILVIFLSIVLTVLCGKL
jgi:hypothetical protein